MGVFVVGVVTDFDSDIIEVGEEFAVHPPGGE